MQAKQRLIAPLIEAYIGVISAATPATKPSSGIALRWDSYGSSWKKSHSCSSFFFMKPDPATSFPTAAASSTERSIASGCCAIQSAARSSDWKNRDCWQKVPRTQSQRSVGRMSDRTLVVGERSMIPSGVAMNVMGWLDTSQAEWTRASSASNGENRTVSKAHQV
jgi:hypothetical protein